VGINRQERAAGLLVQGFHAVTHVAEWGPSVASPRPQDERHPSEIIVGGTSAGGNLAAALILQHPDEGLPLPAAVMFNTGAFDLTGSGDSCQNNDGLDKVLSGPVGPWTELYAGGHDRREPYISPLFGDLAEFPPVIPLSGTRDRVLSNNVRMHRALRGAGVEAELHVRKETGSRSRRVPWAPEDAERFAELRRFAGAHLVRADR
jgi:epsilon-lactone hydrolase